MALDAQRLNMLRRDVAREKSKLDGKLFPNNYRRLRCELDIAEAEIAAEGSSWRALLTAIADIEKVRAPRDSDPRVPLIIAAVLELAGAEQAKLERQVEDERARLAPILEEEAEREEQLRIKRRGSAPAAAAAPGYTPGVVPGRLRFRRKSA